mgnify:CR=1 FL=1
MVTPMAVSPSSPERSMNGDNTDPESTKKLPNDDGFPAPIATETPLRHTRIIEKFRYIEDFVEISSNEIFFHLARLNVKILCFNVCLQ